MDGQGGELKMWLAVRRDVSMPPGAFESHVGDAFGRLYLSALRDAPEAFAGYLDANEPKITVRAENEAMLLRVEREARERGIPVQAVTDANSGAAMVCAFGPSRREDVGPFLKRLRILDESMDLPSEPAVEEPEDGTTMWVAVRSDLALTLGKYGAQIGHAYGRLYLSASQETPEAFAAYLDAGEPKVTVRADGEKMLRFAEDAARERGIPVQLIRDAGRSEIAANTATVCAFGPARCGDVGSFLKRLRVPGEPMPSAAAGPVA